MKIYLLSIFFLFVLICPLSSLAEEEPTESEQTEVSNPDNPESQNIAPPVNDEKQAPNYYPNYQESISDSIDTRSYILRLISSLKAMLTRLLSYLAFWRGNSQEQKMAQCLGDVQNVLNERQREELIVGGVSPNDVVCPDMDYLADHNIWYAEYPSEGLCYDGSKGISGGNISRPPSVAKYIPEAERQDKLNQCQQHLADLKAGKNPEPPSTKEQQMAQCLVDIQDVLNERHKEELIAEGVNSNDVVCANRGYFATYIVWHVKYPLKGTCYDKNMGTHSQYSQRRPCLDHHQSLNIYQNGKNEIN